MWLSIVLQVHHTRTHLANTLNNINMSSNLLRFCAYCKRTASKEVVLSNCAG
jgi:hypothetical protein